MGADLRVAQLTTAGQYRTFLSLLSQTDPATTLPPGAVTVFAPTDAAVYQLTGQLPSPVGTAAQWRHLVLNHIVRGSLTTDQLRSGTPLATLRGGSVAVTTTSSVARLGTGNVTLTPIVTTDVTTYPIDAVPVPSGS